MSTRRRAATDSATVRSQIRDLRRLNIGGDYSAFGRSLGTMAKKWMAQEW